MKATYLFLESDDLVWDAPDLGDDLGSGGEVTRDAQGCGGGYPPLGLLERDIIISLYVFTIWWSNSHNSFAFAFQIPAN